MVFHFCSIKVKNHFFYLKISTCWMNSLDFSGKKFQAY